MELDGAKRPQIAMKRGRSKVLHTNEFIFLKAYCGDTTPRGTQKKSLGLYEGKGFGSCLFLCLFVLTKNSSLGVFIS